MGAKFVFEWIKNDFGCQESKNKNNNDIGIISIFVQANIKDVAL